MMYGLFSVPVQLPHDVAVLSTVPSAVYNYVLYNDLILCILLSVVCCI